MNASNALLTIRWLIRDTFRQAVASRISWLMLLVSGLAVIVCLSMSFEGDDAKKTGVVTGVGKEYFREESVRRVEDFWIRTEGARLVRGNMTMLFGTVNVPVFRDRVSSVRYVQWILAAAVADTAGLILALIFTSSFLPTFLEPSNAAVLLAKPIPRWSLLAGKFLGVILWVLVQATILVGGTWAALGIRTGVWDPLYLFSIPMLLLHFAIFYSFSTFLAVWTRSTVACVFGSILFWLMCWGMNVGHHSFKARQLDMPRHQFQSGDLLVLGATPTAPPPLAAPWAALAWQTERPKAPINAITPASSFMMGAGYWLMPKPADLGILLYDSLEANNWLTDNYRILREHKAFHPELSIFTSLLFMLLLLALAGYEFVHTEY